jgi:hypothetical protein
MPRNTIEQLKALLSTVGDALSSSREVISRVDATRPPKTACAIRHSAIPTKVALHPPRRLAPRQKRWQDVGTRPRESVSCQRLLRRPFGASGLSRICRSS